MVSPYIKPTILDPEHPILCRIMASFDLPPSSDQCFTQIKSSTVAVIGDQGHKSPLCFACCPWSSLLQYQCTNQGPLLFEFNDIQNGMHMGTRETILDNLQD